MKRFSVFFTALLAVVPLHMALAQSNALPPPYVTQPASNPAHAIGWPRHKTPVAPSGYQVTKFAGDLNNPRNIYVAPDGDVFVAEPDSTPHAEKWLKGVIAEARHAEQNGDAAGKILVFRDADNDGAPDVKKVFMSGLNRPFGMLALHNFFYVADEDAVWRYPYADGDLAARTPGQKIMALPAGGDHRTRTLAASADGQKIYVSIGSASNAGELGAAAETGRAVILSANPDGSGVRVYASGLRDASALAVDPDGQLWTAVNERDGLGDDLVPDFLTHVEPGDFYGWPYSYIGGHLDPRITLQRPDLVRRAVVPDYLLGAHVAPLGLAFYSGPMFPADYAGGAFIGEHGAWNRKALSGYKVVFVPFRDGAPAGPAQDFLTGFVVKAGGKKIYGRPVGLAVAADGALLVADDAGNTIWRVSVQDD